MSQPEFSFKSRQQYLDHQRSHVENVDIRDHKIYTAFSLLTPTFSNHHAVMFPVKFEGAHQPISVGKSPLATIAMRMFLLDEDYRPTGPSTPGIIEAGIWELDQPIHIDRGTSPVNKGYLLLSLPGDFTMDNVHNDGKQDPRSTRW